MVVLKRVRTDQRMTSRYTHVNPQDSGKGVEWTTDAVPLPVCPVFLLMSVRDQDDH